MVTNKVEGHLWTYAAAARVLPPTPVDGGTHALPIPQVSRHNSNIRTVHS